MTDWQRLEQLIKWTGLSTNAFAMVVGLRRSENLYQIKRGNHGISKVLAAQIAAKYPGVNRAWLLMEQGEMFLPGFIPGVGAGVAAPQGPQIKPEVEPRSGIDVPFFDRDVVRLISEMGGVWDRAGKPTDHIRVPGLGDCDFAAIHTGSTLAPEVPSGAIVALKAVALDAPLLPGEIYLVVTSDLAGSPEIAEPILFKPRSQFFGIKPSQFRGAIDLFTDDNTLR